MQLKRMLLHSHSSILTPEITDPRIIQAGCDFGRSLVPPPAPSRVSCEVKVAALGL